ncbi:flavin reductase family protein [Thermoactinospora rubra]|uniref:flavin reductase family protein n=1 Tax=Thermoactinospora rubra TaxID=1088767 RepID=UPI001F0A24F7|nr:flavin reductase family protein [Thermoactinospora rubra]
MHQGFSIDAKIYRRVVGRFATGVVIVTTRLGEVDHAMTVNSFTSVSLDPLLVLFCADKRSRFRELVLDSGVWGVSVLPASMEDASRYFSEPGRPVAARLKQWPHHHGPSGVTLFDAAIATLECRTWAVHEAGDHSIVVGEVTSLATPVEEAAPLIFHEGRYRTL